MATEILRPNAAGDETNGNWLQYPASGAHWDKVDEEVPDDAATYLYTDASSFGDEDYNLPAHPVGSGTINYIKVYVRCKSDVLNYYKGYYRIYCKTNGTLVHTSDAVLALAYTNYSQQWSTNPVTGLAWTWAEIDALQIGVSFVVSPYWAGHYAYCTQVYVEIGYTPPTTGYKDTATRFKLWVRGYRDIATRFKLTVLNYKDIATRFRLNLPYYQDIATRFRLQVQNYKDAATRFKLWVQGYKDIATRFKLWAQSYKDIATRFKLTVQAYRDIATRFILSVGVVAYKDIATRFALWAQAYQDISTRFKLTVQGYQDISTRFILTVLSFKDIATRFQLIIQAYQDISTRFRLWAQGYQDIATRFRLGLPYYQDISTRFILTVLSFKDIATRFRLIAQAYQDIATRFKLTVRGYQDIATRFRLWVQSYKDIAIRFGLWGVTTQVATNVLPTQATLNGTIVSPDGVNCIVRGFEWGTVDGGPYPNTWTEEGNFAPGTFSHMITGLAQGQTFYYRAKAAR